MLCYINKKEEDQKMMSRASWLLCGDGEVGWSYGGSEGLAFGREEEHWGGRGEKESLINAPAMRAGSFDT